MNGITLHIDFPPIGLLVRIWLHLLEELVTLHGSISLQVS